MIKVADEKTNSPVGNATISINGKRYFAADDKGEFKFKADYLSDTDTIRISSVGYQSNVFIVGKGNLLPEQIHLMPDIKQLDEVEITARKRKEIVLGVSKSIPIDGGLPTYLNWRYALYIPNTEGISGLITELAFDVTNGGHGIEKPFKVNIYSVSLNTKLPDRPLINDDVLVYNPKKKRQVIVDIAKYNIRMPEGGVFIVAEILSKEYYSSTVFFWQGQNWNKLPAFSESSKKGGYLSFSQSIHEGYDYFPWHAMRGFNFGFTARILKD